MRYNYDRRTASVEPTFFLLAFQAQVKRSAKEIVEAVVDLVRVDQEEGTLDTHYAEILAKLKQDPEDVFANFDLSEDLEAAVQSQIAAQVYGSMEPSVDHLTYEIDRAGVTLRFRLWYGEADPDNTDEAANAPDVDSLLKDAFGAGGCSGRIDGIEEGAFGTYMFTFNVTVEKRVSLADLIENTLGARIKAEIEERLK